MSSLRAKLFVGGLGLLAVAIGAALVELLEPKSQMHGMKERYDVGHRQLRFDLLSQ